MGQKKAGRKGSRKIPRSQARATQSSTRRKAGDEQILPDHTSPEFAHLVATFAWRDGLAANAIAKKLFGDSSPLHLMQVKRALIRAHKMPILRLVPPESLEMQYQLNGLVNSNRPERPINFHVVTDSVRTEGAPVYAKAAEVISSCILEAAQKCPSQPEPSQVVICNAGGRTVSETVKALTRNPPVLADSEEEAERLRTLLLFVAGNAAYDPEQFHRSANFLSVTMAELFGAGHLALPKEEDEKLSARHAELVERAALFICGVGSRRPGDQASLMAQYFQKKGWELPKDAVGDIAFNLLDRQGGEVDLPSADSRQFMRTLNPSLNLARLMHIGRSRRVVVILDAKDPKSKCEIGIALLRRRYATDVVLGTRLAAEIVKEWKGEL